MEKLRQTNEIVLQRISEQVDDTILGFLPLTEVETDESIEGLRKALRERDIMHLFLLFPAGTAYALASAISQKKSRGVWILFANEFGIQGPTDLHEEVAERFQSVCKKIGLKNGEVSVDVPTVRPFIYQAGIRHYWIEPLLDALKSTLRNRPAPDLDDSNEIKLFAGLLSSKIYNNQASLREILCSEVGPMLTRRIVAAYLNGEQTLPAHLQPLLNELMEDSGHAHQRKSVLRTPYLYFDPVYQKISVVLPEIPARFRTEDTLWRINGLRYAVHSRKVLPVREIGADAFQIDLQHLAGEYEDRHFEVDAEISDTKPFRLFSEETGREYKLDHRLEEFRLPIGTYTVVMLSSVTPGESNDHELPGGLLTREMSIRPGLDAVSFAFGDRAWRLIPILKSGSYIHHTAANYVELNQGGRLHYGNDLGLVFYFPNTEEFSGTLTLGLECRELGNEATHDMTCDRPAGELYSFHSDLQVPVAAFLDALPPGIHRLRISMGNVSQRVEQSLWYWKGLRTLSPVLGFTCEAFPGNLDLQHSRGVERSGDHDLKIPASYSSHRIRLSLTRPAETLELPRTGVRAFLHHNADTETEVDPGEVLDVPPDDKRIAGFASGGYQSWDIKAKGKSIIRLTRSRKLHLTGLAGIVHHMGGSGDVVAVGEDGTRVPLMRLGKPLLADHLEHKWIEDVSEDEWTFEVGVKEGSALGVAFTNLSDAPWTAPDEVREILQWQGTLPETGELTAHNLFEVRYHLLEQAAAENALLRSFRLSLRIRYTDLQRGLWAIDFQQRLESGGIWSPLPCRENHGVSHLRILAYQKTTPAPEDSWWVRMRIELINRAHYPSSELKQQLAALNGETLDKALSALSRFNNWKYPAEIYRHPAQSLLKSTIWLARNTDLTAPEIQGVWWANAAEELSYFCRKREPSAVETNLLFSTRLKILYLPGANAHSFSDPGLMRSPVGRLLFVPASIHAAGGKTTWILKQTQSQSLPIEVVTSFANWPQVNADPSKKLKGFSLRQFLGDGNGGLYSGVVKYDENKDRALLNQVLSAAQLHDAIHHLNRRCCLLNEIVAADPNHVLGRITQRLLRLPPGFQAGGQTNTAARQLGWHENIQAFPWWVPPLLEKGSHDISFAERIAGLAWMTAALTRLHAHTPGGGPYLAWLDQSLRTDIDFPEQSIRLLLNFAPELLAFYIALFEISIDEPQTLRPDHA